MKRIIQVIILILLTEVTFQQCANPLTPTGGPKDTIPPTLLLSEPLDQTINFKGNEFTLYFDEFITADQLKQNLIITPYSDIKYKSTVKRRDLILKFEGDFLDSTTYTLNFFDGVTDITEKNPAENLIIAFSTGDYIDSLRTIGSVRDLLTNKPIPKMTVGLYIPSDTLDIFIDKPYYFVNTSEKGTFEIKNIKNRNYIIVAFIDENRNLSLDPATETYAFLKDTLSPSVDPDSLYLKGLQLDASELKFISARPSGRYFDARYSKPVNSYSIVPIDSSKTVFHNLTTEKDAIRFYNTSTTLQTDSTGIIINAQDSIHNSTLDTVYVKFRETARKATEFTQTMYPPSATNINQNSRYTIEFSKPILQVDTTFLSYSLDTLYTFPLPIHNLNYNFNNTQISFQTVMDKTIYNDTLESLLLKHTPDTSNIDSTNLIYYHLLSKLPKNKVKLDIASNAFISVEQDSSKNFSQSYSFLDPENFGIIKLKITTEKPSYIVQILNKQGNVSKQLTNCTSCRFDMMKPDSYSVRVLLDQNQNGIWDIGNIRNFEEPEPVIHFPKASELRANWTLELEYSF
ncbi:MAG: Ig-like domain-containing domain [Cyclobacteriaceae bacterium]